MDFKSFVLGVFSCMLLDVLFAIANFFLQRSFFYRKDELKNRVDMNEENICTLIDVVECEFRHRLDALEKKQHERCEERDFE